MTHPKSSEETVVKHCSKCGIEKQEVEFYKDRSSKDGLTSSCKSCQLRRLNSYYNKNKKERQQVNRDKYKPVEKKDKKCIYCGSTFKGKGTTTYCSKDCKDAVRREKDRARYHSNKGTYEFNCKGCGKVAYASEPKRMNYCTHKCYSQNAPHFRNRTFRRPCSTCNKEFISRSNNARYCSDQCRDKKAPPPSNAFKG